MELQWFATLFMVGHLTVIVHGTDVSHTRDVLTNLKRDLRNELLSELKQEIRNEVQTHLKAAIQEEIKAVLQDAANVKDAEKQTDREWDKYSSEKQTIGDLIKEVVRMEITDGIGNKIKNELRQMLPEILASSPVDNNSSRNTDIKQLRNRRGNQIARAEGSNSAVAGLLNLKPRAFTYRPVAFSVYLDHIMDHVHKGQPVKFNRVQLNENNVYNVHTGTFTAPVSGVYLFHFEFIGWSRKTELKLIVDNNIVATSVVEHQGTTPYIVKAGSMTLVHVDAGQAVWVENFAIDDAQIIASDSDKSSAFLGVLLY